MSDSVERKFSKARLIKSKRFENRRDLLNALLVNDKKYSIEETEEIINNYMEGEVK